MVGISSDCRFHRFLRFSTSGVCQKIIAEANFDDKRRCKCLSFQVHDAHRKHQSPECIGNQYPYEYLMSLREDSSSHILSRRCIHTPNCIDIVSAYDDRDKHRAFTTMMMIHSKSFVHFSIEREERAANDRELRRS